MNNGYDWTTVVWLYNNMQNMIDAGKSWSEIAEAFEFSGPTKAMRAYHDVSKIYYSVTH